MSKQSPTPDDVEKLMREMGFGDEDVAGMREYLKKYEPKPSVDEQKAKTLERVQTFMDEVLKPYYIRPVDADNDKYPYTVDLTVEWRKNTLYFTKHMHDPRPSTSKGEDQSSIVYDYARISRVGQNRYNVAYKRHTGKYFILYYDLDLEACLEALNNDMLLAP